MISLRKCFGGKLQDKTISIALTILILLIVQLSSDAQSSGQRPKVGLALSGGGSLGFAHVGVLKVMEEAGLRPDMISGVSMGSIIGGMYAIGYDPDTLHYILRNIDWDLILSNKIPENKVIFTEKHNFNNSVISLPVSSKKVRFPSGLINGQKIESLLSFYAWPAAHISDFSKLPVPFMCLATDIITIQKVDLTHGYLPDAMRASMAVPSIFTPFKTDTAMLIDGGVLRNIAISELKDMGADIIIGSYTGFHLYNVDELESMAGIMKQIGFLNSFTDYKNQKEMADILIEPYLKDFSSTVFNNADSIIERGYKAALPFKESFRRLADSLNRFGSQPIPEHILDRQYYMIDRIEITGNSINSNDQILGVLDIKPGLRINKYLMSERIELLYGKMWFEKVKYRLVPRNDSMILVIDCIEKPNAILYGSVHHDNALESGIALNLSLKNFPGRGSMTNISSYISKFYRVRLSNTLFIDRHQEFGLTTVFYTENTNIPVIKLKNEIGQVYGKSYLAGASLNKSLGLNNMMSLSVNLESMDHIPKYISLTGLKKLSYNYWSAECLYQANSLDSKHFPKSGNISQVSFEMTKLFSGNVKSSVLNNTYREEYPDDFLFKRAFSASGSFRHYFPGGRKMTFTIGGDALLTFDADSVTSPNNYHYLGGISAVSKKSISMTGFHSNEIIIDKVAAIGLDADIEIAANLYLSIMTDMAVAHEAGNDKKLSYLAGYGMGAGYMSVVGPIRIGVMHGLSSRNRYFEGIKGYISLGYCF